MNSVIQKCITYRKIVELFLRYPRREFTIRELSILTKVSYASTWRFIKVLDQAGIIFTRKIGFSVACSINKTSPLLRKIKRAIWFKLTPHQGSL
jgi:hypothetical protein